MPCPVLIPGTHGDLASLLRAAEAADRRGIAAILDPVLDPIHFGFMDSLSRYAELRRNLPAAEILMGTGNLTELTDAEFGGDDRDAARYLLRTAHPECPRRAGQPAYAPHPSGTRRGASHHVCGPRGRRACRKDYGAALLALHERKPFPYTPGEIAELAAQVTDKNFRIEIADDGIHVYNRDGHHVAQDALSLFSKIDVGRDGAHTFYLGAELMRAEIAWRLGKRYAQDEPLDWGCAVDRPSEDLTRLREVGHTLGAATLE